MKRVVEPESLDGLSGEDPAAIRSRRDLRMINWFMGNEGWIQRQIEEGESMVELGAGTGELTGKLSDTGKVTGLDFQGKPRNLEVDWKQGDLFETMPDCPGDTVVANLILHHFDDEQLKRLGGLIGARKKFVAVEPYRSCRSLFQGSLLWPAINAVTKHDMMVSIRAGFRRGELSALLQLGERWQWREEVSFFGGIRVVAWRE